MKRNLLFLIIVTFTACKTPTERWLAGMEDFREVRSATLSLQALRMKESARDTAELNYKVRIYPSRAWLGANSRNGRAADFYYHMDSAFTVKYGNQTMQPQLVQPVANGLSTCFEYLVTIAVTPGLKMKTLSILYRDRFIDGKTYEMNLNRP
ncbi:hypothetical protein ACFGVS_01025 [Mucilaginibacter sp. AW1-7]|jgi:hypothetical protein|uniref:hypothetical protein n=1 Tax=Mucilaginibacter sp. AW1-7 TaxID=3349874 RepID=UPI003F738D3C